MADPQLEAEARAWVESELSDQSFAELSEDEQREIDAWAFSVVPPRICGELPPQGETGSGTRQEPKGGGVEQEQRAAAEEDEMPGANAEEGMPSRPILCAELVTQGGRTDPSRTGSSAATFYWPTVRLRHLVLPPL